MGLAEKLTEELQSKTVFTIHFPVIGDFNITESIVITWCIMLFLMILTLVFVRNLKLNPGKPQLVIEMLVGFMDNFFTDLMGHKGKRYIPYLGSVLIYLVIANVIGLFGITPPTKDLNITAGLALMSIVLIEFSGIRERGFKGYIKSFASPMPLMIPFNILEIFIRPLSLCMRLFGNVFGAFIIMELIKLAIFPAIIPIPFSFYFDIFDGILQAYVFCFLTSLFISEKIE